MPSVDELVSFGNELGGHRLLELIESDYKSNQNWITQKDLNHIAKRAEHHSGIKKILNFYTTNKINGVLHKYKNNIYQSKYNQKINFDPQYFDLFKILNTNDYSFKRISRNQKEVLIKSYENKQKVPKMEVLMKNFIPIKKIKIEQQEPIDNTISQPDNTKEKKNKINQLLNILQEKSQKSIWNKPKRESNFNINNINFVRTKSVSQNLKNKNSENDLNNLFNDIFD